jgi:hypothetical protein
MYTLLYINVSMYIIVIYTVLSYVNAKGKEVPNRPGVAQRVPGGLGSQIS